MTTATATRNFANWNLDSYFREFDAPDYRQYKDEYRTRLAAALERFRELGPVVDGNREAWVEALLEHERVVVLASHLGSYVGCLRAADQRVEAYHCEFAWLYTRQSEHQKIEARILTAFRETSEEAFRTLLADRRLADAGYALSRLRELSRRRMPVELEELVADLAVDGFTAFGRLYDQLAGRLEFDLARPGGTIEKTPMSLARSLLEDRDPDVRKAALAGSNEAWSRVSHVTAACLNAISGHRLTLYRRRGIEHFLEPALFDAAITTRTLEALLEAIESKVELPRRYLRLKAKILGKPRLGFQDLSAPLPLPDLGPVDWAETRRRIERAFSIRYPALGEFARRAFDANWIESEPRAGKSPGGFCTSSLASLESRIFMTFQGTLGNVQTLAHELGHAFHNWVMRDLRPMTRRYPMTLAETASTFAENLYTDSVLENPGTTQSERAAILDTRLESAAAYLLNIPMRFTFEKAFYEERRAGELGASRLDTLMLESQRRWYGDVLDDRELDPRFWASKLHFYKTGVSFYNFPYSFGYLFSQGVFARWKAEGPSFLPRYEELLRWTGRATAEEVARRALGVDLEKPEFWVSAISPVEEDLRRYEEIAPRLSQIVS